MAKTGGQWHAGHACLSHADDVAPIEIDDAERAPHRAIEQSNVPASRESLGAFGGTDLRGDALSHRFDVTRGMNIGAEHGTESAQGALLVIVSAAPRCGRISCGQRLNAICGP